MNVKDDQDLIEKLKKSLQSVSLKERVRIFKEALYHYIKKNCHQMRIFYKRVKRATIKRNTITYFFSFSIILYKILSVFITSKNILLKLLSCKKGVFFCKNNVKTTAPMMSFIAFTLKSVVIK